MTGGSMVLNHLLTALIAWLTGALVGGGLGYVCAVAIRGLFGARTAFRRLVTLAPWRTVMVTLPLLSPLIPAWVGLGRLSAWTEGAGP